MNKVRSNPPRQSLTDTTYVDTNYTTAEERRIIYQHSLCGFLGVSRLWIRQLGITDAVILANYVDKYDYFRNRYPDNNGWFFLSHEQIIDELQIAPFAVSSCKKRLVELGVLQVRKIGMPAKEWLNICTENLANLQDIIASIPCDATDALDPKKTKGLDPKKTKGLDPKKTKGQQIIINNNLINNPKRNNNKKNTKKSFENFAQEEMDIIPLTKQLLSVTMFDKWWKLYPRKVNKSGAEKAFKTICVTKDRPTWGQVKSALLRQMKSDQWKSPQYIPHPTTWLNQHRWEEELPASTGKTKFYMNENEESDPIKHHDYEI